MSFLANSLEKWAERFEDPEWQANAARWAAEEREREEANRRAETISAARSAGVPLRHLEAIVAGGLSETPARAALREPFGIVVLSGGPGAGKTMAAAEWLYRGVEEVVRRHGSPTVRGWAKNQFVTSAHLARWKRYDDDAMADLLLNPRLVLDDLGVEYVDEKGSYLALLDEVVNKRYSERRPLVLTTNLGAEAWVERYGDRFASRIRQCGRFVQVGDVDLRRGAR